jgi:hypothetical protein
MVTAPAHQTPALALTIAAAAAAAAAATAAATAAAAAAAEALSYTLPTTQGRGRWGRWRLRAAAVARSALGDERDVVRDVASDSGWLERRQWRAAGPRLFQPTGTYRV